MASWDTAAEMAEFDRSIGITSSTLQGGYLRVHDVEGTPPATLPSEYGEEITLFTPGPEHLAATDWRKA